MTVQTSPAGADVRLDGAALGQTPLKVDLPPGKHLLTLSKPGYGEIKRPVGAAKNGDVISVELTDLELSAATKAVAAAEAAYDKANARLEALQQTPSAAGSLLEKAEAAMLKASEKLEDAQRALAKLKERKTGDAEKTAEAARLAQYAHSQTTTVPDTALNPRSSQGGVFYCGFTVKRDAQTLTGCSAKSSASLFEAKAACEKTLNARLAHIEGSGDVPSCHCGLSLSAVTPAEAEMCQ